MRKILSLLIILINFISVTQAKHVDEATAKRVGMSFLTTSTNSIAIKSPQELELVYTISNNSTTVNYTTVQETYFYIFNSSTNGFVIVSGDDNVVPILGYSDESTFNPKNISPATQKWLEEYKNQIRYIVENNVSATEEIRTQWNVYLTNPSQGTSGGNEASVSPLLQTKWNQSPYVNDMCPNGTVTGCVATAMAQVMKYWNYPTSGSGFHSYNHSNYGTLSANFGSTTYNWNSMPNQVNSSNSAVATLMYHCGISVDMNYGPASSGGSGAYVISAQSPVQHCTEYALKTYFGYKNTLKGVQRASYSESSWVNLIKTEIDNGRPVIYAGFGSGGGHCFVADGYDNNGYFHFNWGWGGAYDGYFNVNALNPAGVGTGGGSGGFNSGHQAVIGVEPINRNKDDNDNGGGNFEKPDIRLYSSLDMPETQIWFTTPFSLSVDIGNWGPGDFNGQLAAAVFDKDLNFVKFMDEISSSITNGYYKSTTFSNSGTAAFVPGTYYVAIFYKTSEVGWTIVDDGLYSNIKQFKVIYTTDIETNSDFNITGGKLIQGTPANINVDILNTGNTTFYGEYRISISNLDGSIAQTLPVKSESNGLPNNYHYKNGLDFTEVINVSPGTYLMQVAYKRDGTNNWYYAGSKNFQNPIYVRVEVPAIEPDMYENNNTESNAYQLSLIFNNNTANKNTAGSNFHTGADNDFYKIVLPTGYNYTIKARLHDSYNSGNGKVYTADGLFSYSTNGSTWSDSYDDIMNNNIQIANGGTVYFLVAPYFSGETGTYLLDLNVSRTPLNTGVQEVAKNDLIALYPNPSNDIININFNNLNKSVKSIALVSIQGQILMTQDVSNQNSISTFNISNLPSGVYFAHIHLDSGVLTKKLIIQK